MWNWKVRVHWLCEDITHSKSGWCYEMKNLKVEMARSKLKWKKTISNDIMEPKWQMLQIDLSWQNKMP